LDYSFDNFIIFIFTVIGELINCFFLRKISYLNQRIKIKAFTDNWIQQMIYITVLISKCFITVLSTIDERESRKNNKGPEKNA